jgi:hypothetical protein
MLCTKISIARNAKHIRIPQTLAIISGLLGEIGFNSISYPINLNIHLKYQRSILTIIWGVITIRIESNKQMVKNKFKIILTITGVYCISIALSTIISGVEGICNRKTSFLHVSKGRLCPLKSNRSCNIFMGNKRTIDFLVVRITI